MFSMSLRLWAGSMSFSRLDQGNLFQQRAEGSERPCHVVIRQRAHTGKREGWIQISDQRSCPSKRSSLRLLRQTPALAPWRSCLPCSCPRPTARPESALLIAIARPGGCAASLALGKGSPAGAAPWGRRCPGRAQRLAGSASSRLGRGSAARPARSVGSSEEGDEAGDHPAPLGALVLLPAPRAGRGLFLKAP